jgi:alpha-beta hydrolase superfamily lysophospholipase
VTSVPLWLGTKERPLFAWLDLPDDGLVAGAAVVCPSLGLEAEYSLRALADLGRRFAQAGWAALRIDYAGTGDSAGTWRDPHLVDDWLSDVRGAVEYAGALGAKRLAVVGMRIGATLAAAEIGRGGGVDDLVLWDPNATGRAFLREQRALWAFLRDQATESGTLKEGEDWGAGGGADDGSVESPGLLLSAATVAELEPLAIPPSETRLARRELVLVRQGRKVPRGLAERLALPHVESTEVGGQDELLDVSAVTPESTLERIVSWVTGQGEPASPVVRMEPPEAAPAIVSGPGAPTPVVERPLAIGPARLFGILSEPEDGLPPGAPTAIFLNAGRIGHHGPARLWVDLARTWAARGVRGLRVDLNGLGDSPTRPGRSEQIEFPADALQDLADIRVAMESEPPGAVILIGLCSGGYHAIESALETPVASLCVVNPAITYYRSVEPPPRRFEPNVSFDASEREAWGSTRPTMSRAIALLDPLRSAARRVPGIWWIHKRLVVTASPAGMFGRLAESGVDVLLVAGSVEERKLCRGELGRFRRLFRGGLLTMAIIPSLEHSLFEKTGRDRVAELLDPHVARWTTDERGHVDPDTVR